MEKDSKIETKEALIDYLEDDHCLIHVNTTYPGVILPQHAKKEMTITLKLSYYFAGSVALRDDLVEAELRFGAAPFNCLIPYESIWAITSVAGVHKIWDKRSPSMALPILLRGGVVDDDEKSNDPKKQPQSSEKSEDKKERPSFLKRVK
jgi:stringent starvation protein B